MIKRNCLICGKEFLKQECHVKRGQGKYCSVKCQSTNLSLLNSYLVGEKGRNWRGGSSSVLLNIRKSQKGLRWRQKIFIRDNFTCRKCGQHGGKLEAHHKKRFSDIIIEIKHNLPLLSLYGAAMIYNPLWDINNGYTLCIKCHKEEHKNKR